jgi:hypothetical protein
LNTSSLLAAVVAVVAATLAVAVVAVILPAQRRLAREQPMQLQSAAAALVELAAPLLRGVVAEILLLLASLL